MKKKIMRIFCCIMATFFLSIPGMAYATEAGNTPIDVVQNFDVQILSTDVKHNRSLAKVTTHTANGEIINNGVRLRKSPSTSATILELMYDGELIWIDWSAYGSAGLNWHRVQRIITGTYGWGLRKTIIYCRGLCSLHFLNKKDADNMHIRLNVNFRKPFADFNCLIYVTEK